MNRTDPGVVARAAAALAEAGLPSPGADARLLVAHVLGVDLFGLLLAPEPTAAQQAQIDELVRRRVAGTPVQHITGRADFRYETVAVGPGVFVPRPETEVLVDLALAELARRPADRRRVVELGAGSGVIALSLARELGGVEIHAVELSDRAWPYLQQNLAGVAVALVHGDMADAFDELAGAVDLVISNPPYVPDTLRGRLPRDVEGQDPDLALFSGADGLDAIRVVRERAVSLLRPGGWVMIEHDESHAAEVVELFSGPEFEDVSDHADLAGRPRHLTARRSSRVARGRIDA